ncbi:TetR/AcrR family transcriptional regulator [Actinomycetospora sp. C-140]
MTSAARTSVGSDETPSRRERMRALTVREILTIARELVVELGHTGLTTRAVARRMQMSSPALYRYFASHEELKDVLLAELFDELSAHLREAAAAADDTTPLDPLVAASRAMRGWALAHPHEFEFMLVHPMGDPSVESDQLRARREFGGVMLSLLADAARPETMPAPTPVPPPDSVDAMVRYCANTGVDLEPAVAPIAVQCWVRLYGSVSMATMGQLEPLGEHSAAVFEQELDAMARLLGHQGGLPEDTAPAPDRRT